MKQSRKHVLILTSTLLLFTLLLTGCQTTQPVKNTPSTSTQTEVDTSKENIQDILYETNDNPEPYQVWNDNQPSFTSKEKACIKSFESYSDLDELGRPQVAYACISKDLMPTEDRESIGSVKPAGWHTVKYPDTIPDRYLYNRCHLIGFQLAGENANEKNLITGTRYLNVEGMLPFENQIADYVTSTGNHVLYRVTPQYQGEELLARQLLMEAWSVEDNGQGICFAVLCPNIQPGIAINYATGDSKEIHAKPASETDTQKTITVILNTNSGKYHKETCSSVSKMSDKNRMELTKTIEELHHAGYTPCQSCHPDN